MEMFTLRTITLEDVCDSHKTLKAKLLVVEKMANELQQQRFALLKAISEVTSKLDSMCSHDWIKQGTYQFAPYVCTLCGLRKDFDGIKY